MWVLKENLLEWLMVGFFASLFLPPDLPVVNNVFIAAICLLCFAFNPPAEKFRLLLHRRAILFMLLFFALQIGSAAISVDRSRGWSILAMRSPMLLLPLALGGILIRREVKARILSAYAIIVLFVSLCCLVDAVHRTWIRHDTQWLYDDALVRMIGRTAVYMALIVIVAIFCLVWLLDTAILKGRARPAAWCAIVFLVLFHFLLASRISLFYFYATVIAYGYRQFVQGAGRRRMAWFFGGASLTLIFLFFIFPKTMNRMRQLEYLHFDYQSSGMESHFNMPIDSSQWNGANFRLAVWTCGWSVARHHLVTGVPLGDKRDTLMEEYKARDFMFAYSRHRNLHNTWLDVLVNTGIPGCIIFLLGYLVLPVWTSIRSRDWLSLLIVGAFATALSTETWIDGSFGAVLLGFWLSVVNAWHVPERLTPAPRIHRPAAHYP